MEGGTFFFCRLPCGGIINVIPGGIYGPGDKSLINDLMRAFYNGRLPIYVTPGVMLTFGYVEDIAEGHILALEKGKIGESYILAGPAFTLSEVLKLWGELTGRATPLFNVPSNWVRPLAPLFGYLEELLPIPNIIREDTINSSNATYLADASEARRRRSQQSVPAIRSQWDYLQSGGYG